eukprot:scaffold31771_cov129-Isochrysis_galbana.AAC.10
MRVRVSESVAQCSERLVAVQGADKPGARLALALGLALTLDFRPRPPGPPAKAPAPGTGRNILGPEDPVQRHRYLYRSVWTNLDGNTHPYG